MLKKITSIALILVMFACLVACNGTAQPTAAEEAKTEAETTAVEETDVPETEAPDVTETEKPEESEEETEAAETEPAETAGEGEISLTGPYIVTTCGQSPGAVQISMSAKMAQIEADTDNALSADTLDTDTYKTLIVTTGTSMKGMGAAGTDVNAEIDRCVALIEKAKDEGMLIVGAHIEGMARRTDSSDSASIEAIMPLADVILIIKDSDSDGFFTTFAEENDTQLIVVDDAIDVGKVLN